MLTTMILMSSWTLLNLIFKFNFSLTMGSTIVILLMSSMKGYTNLLGHSFTSLILESDFTSTVLINLTLWVTALMFMVSTKYWYESNNPHLFTATLLFLAMILLLFFMADSLLMLYIMFEASLFPTLGLILKWGYQPERLQASLYFMMYTISASLPLLLTIAILWNTQGNLSLTPTSPTQPPLLTCPSYLLQTSLMLAFLVKVPMWGVHLWLPKAHVEAPVSGSMILAGILLKLGGYGLIKIFALTLTLQTNMTNLLLSINLWGAVTVSLVCLLSFDMKVLIAYSSVIHMGFMVVGILTGSVAGTIGAVMMMVGHGFSSPGMFSLANFNYEASGTRGLSFQKGISSLHPTLPLLWFIILMANMAAPPSLNLASEIFIAMATLKLGTWLAIIVGMISFLAMAYNMFLYSAQQGSAGYWIHPGSTMKSNFMLSSALQIIPVFATLWVTHLLYV